MPAVKIPKDKACPRCHRPQEECLCAKAKPLPSRLRILLLQHPQEQWKLLNSAYLAHLSLEKSILKVGLSWPNLKKASGDPEADPKRWGVLYLAKSLQGKEPLLVTTPKREIVTDWTSLDGLVALDGSWKQAHALWWRNPWLQRLSRISINPPRPSLRAQAKREGLATVEAVAFALERLEGARETAETLRKSYEEWVVEPARRRPEQPAT